MTETLIRDLASQVQSGRVIVVVGAGLSLAATNGNPLASWRGLLANGINYAAEIDSSLARNWKSEQEVDLDSREVDRWLLVAERITEALGGPEGGDYGRWLRDSVGSLRCANPQLVGALRRFAKVLVTTNYDGILEQASGLPAITWEQRTDLDRLLRGEAEGILHLHGYWEQPRSVALGVRSYERLLRSTHAQNSLHSLFATHTLLFLGYGSGFEDPNFRALRDWLSDTYHHAQHRHFRLMTGAEVQSASPAIAERIFPVAFGDDHSDLLGFLHRLSGAESGGLAKAGRQPRTPAIPSVGKPRIAISMGDANGIGPEIILKALRMLSPVRKLCIPVVVGSATVLRLERDKLEQRINIPPIEVIASPEFAADSADAIWVIDIPTAWSKLPLSHAPDSEVAKLSIECTRRAIQFAGRGDFAAVVSSPVSKEACLMIEKGVRGHTELIAQILGLTDFGSLYLSPDLAIATVTGHCPLAEILENLTQEKIARTIVRAAEHLMIWRPDAPRQIGVCSIDPHVGEGGRLGRDDQRLVLPAVQRAREQLGRSFTINGPDSADALFRPQIRSNYGLIVAMYHDQAKVAAATIDPNTFAAILLGSPITRTTVAHGTAFDIAGKGTASSANLVRCIEQAVYLSPAGARYLSTSPDVAATTFYSIVERLNRHTKEKNLLGESFVQLPELTQFFDRGSEELRMIVGPGSTPILVIEHFLSWIGRLGTDRQRSLHLLTNNLALLDTVRKRSEMRCRVSIFGGPWDPGQNSLSASRGMDQALLEHRSNLTVISCAGIDFRDGETSFYSYSPEHQQVLETIVRSHQESGPSPKAQRLILLATGEKLGQGSMHRYASASDLPTGAVLLLEADRKIRTARGRVEINHLLAEIFPADLDSRLR